MRRTESISLLSRFVAPRNWRLFLVVRLVKMWRLPACPHLIVPPGRTRKRFLAALLVFIFGITLLSFRTTPFLYDCRWQHYVTLGCLLSLVLQQNRVCRFCANCPLDRPRNSSNQLGTLRKTLSRYNQLRTEYAFLLSRFNQLRTEYRFA